MSGPQMSNSATQLAAWLETHDLHEGIGGYWVASITTVESGGDVRCGPWRPGAAVRSSEARDLTSSDWYEGKKFQFLVYGAPSGYRGIRGATTTWGSPKHVYVVGRYRVLVWNHELGVAAFT